MAKLTHAERPLGIDGFLDGGKYFTAVIDKRKNEKEIQIVDKNKRNTVLFILIAVIFLSAALLGNEIGNYRRLAYESAVSGTEDMSRKFISGTLGEFGKTLAAYLWLKSDFYWHEYQGDWRKDEQIMPLIKMVTLLDPQMAQAYDFGGYHLAMNLGKVHEGVLYLKEGLKYNPDNPGLNFTYALVCRKIKNYYAAAYYGKKAFALSSDRFEKLNSLRIVYNSYADLGDYKDAAETCKLFLKISPKDQRVQGKLKEYEGKLR